MDNDSILRIQVIVVEVKEKWCSARNDREGEIDCGIWRFGYHGNVFGT